MKFITGFSLLLIAGVLLVTKVTWAGKGRENPAFTDGIERLLTLSPGQLKSVRERLESQGELAGFDEELKPIVREIENRLRSEKVTSIAEQNPEIATLRQMILTKLFHVDLKFEMQVEGYPYPIPFEKPFPIRPTLEGLSEAIEFFTMLD